MNHMILLAVTDTIWSRLAVCAVASLFGALLIYIGIQNIKTRTAEESGKRRLVNRALGASNTYVDSKAVAVGWMRVVCGVAAIIIKDGKGEVLHTKDQILDSVGRRIAVNHQLPDHCDRELVDLLAWREQDVCGNPDQIETENLHDLL